MSTHENPKQHAAGASGKNGLWRVVLDGRVWACCFAISAMVVGIVMWEGTLRLRRVQLEIAHEAATDRTLPPLLAKHHGDVRSAMLALASKVERNDGGEVVELSFDYSGITDEDLAHLSQFPDLRDRKSTRLNSSHG